MKRTFTTLSTSGLAGQHSARVSARQRAQDEADQRRLAVSRAQFNRMVQMQERTAAELHKPLERIQAQVDAKNAELDALLAEFEGDDE